MKPRDQILMRMYVVLTLVCIAPVLITLQIIKIHVYEGSPLREKGQKQANTALVIPAMRGAILDREGRSLAVNTARYDLALDPTVSGFSARKSEFVQGLARVTGMSASQIIRTIDGRASPKYVRLVRGLDEARKEEIESWGIPGVLSHPTFARRYNYGETLSHVLGHVDEDGHGLAGLELMYEEYLSGRDGRRSVKRDRRGVVKAYVGGPVVEPEDGESLVLTIDLVRQTAMEEELARGVRDAGAVWGTAIAMDPNTGEILGLANYPTYDSNRPAGFSDSERRNRAITDRMEPGSTFKLVAAVAAIERRAVSLGDTIDTGNGYRRFGRRNLHDTHGHGRIPFSEVIAVSSNIGVATVAQDLDGGLLFQYARNLGFGQPTYIDLPGEISGRLKKPAEWSGTTKISMSIGYEVEVTPLQILTAYASLANGGSLLRPYVVSQRRDVTGKVVWSARQDSIRRAFKSKTARTLLPAFEAVVDSGTATRAGIDGLRVAGKTGTAWKVMDGSYTTRDSRASFVGFFPADDPEVVMIVVLDEPRTSIYGGIVAAPIFQRIGDRWSHTFPELARRRVAIARAETPRDTVRTRIPPVEGQPISIAASRLRAQGYDVQDPDESEITAPVRRQRPSGGSLADRGARVVLAASGDTDPDAPAQNAMPDLRGLSARQAVFWLSREGVQAKVEGHGRVIAQWPRPGSAITRTVELRCR